MQVYVNPMGLLHVTIFNVSRPNDPRPNPRDPTGGCNTTHPPHLRRAPFSRDLTEERKLVKSIVGRVPSPCLTVHRAFMADTGTLVLTWTDPCGGIARLRKDLSDSFPGKPRAQSNIIHTSLIRVLSQDTIPPSVIKKIVEICDDWSAQWKETKYFPHKAWFVYEETFGIVIGPRISIPFKSALHMR